MSTSSALKQALNLIKPYQVPGWASKIKCAPKEFVDVSFIICIGLFYKIEKIENF